MAITFGNASFSTNDVSPRELEIDRSVVFEPAHFQSPNLNL